MSLKRGRIVVMVVITMVIILLAGAYVMIRTSAAPHPLKPQSKLSSPQNMPGMTTAAPTTRSVSQSIPDMSEAPTIEIPMDKLQLIGVRTVTANFHPVIKNIRATGRIVYNEQKRYVVNAKIEGWIDTLYADYTGKYIRQGDPIAEIYSPEFIAAQQEFLTLLQRTGPVSTTGNTYRDNLSSMLAQDNQVVLAGARQKLHLLDISDRQIDEIARSGVPKRTFTLFSPHSGYIIGKEMFQGQKFMTGEKIIELADLSSVWVIADVYSNALAFVRAGLPASIDFSYFPGRRFYSSIAFVYPALAVDTRTLQVRFTVANPDLQLKPNMFGDININVNLGTHLTVPQEALIDSGQTQLVYIDKGVGIFEPRTVLTGISSDGQVEIVSGLKAGDKVVDAANFLLDSEARLKGMVK